MSQPTVAVIIVSFNTVNLLRNCLASLGVCSLPLHTVVVDNQSCDDSAAMVRAEFPHVMLVESGYNAGFAGGTKLGLATLEATEKGKLGGNEPGSDYVLVLNPDTVVQPGAIEAMVGFLEAHPRVGLVGPRLLNPDGSFQPAAFRFPTLVMTAFDLFPPGEVLPGRLYGSWWHGRYPQDGGNEPFAIDHPLGACMLVRREVLATVGSMDERYFMYSEEIEWCWRIRQAGWAIWQVPAARVTHVGGASTGQFRHKMLLALWRSRNQFVAERNSAWYLGAHRAVVRTGMVRLALATWLAHGRGQLTRDDLRARLWAYGEVSRL
jgi:N-acetylglucosaminyl-diphospho-decaprenol L-rhamnosyltransferase